MNCPKCLRDGPPSSKFCLECGAKIALRCTNCAAELPAGARFCNECGDPLSVAPAGPHAGRSRSSPPAHLAEKIPTSRGALAMTIARELGFRPLEARCQMAIGRMLKHTGELVPAREHLVTAVEMFGEMGMRFWLERARSELEDVSA